MRKLADPKRSDFSPVEIDFGPVEVVIGRHFGFCYGVENAIEISYKALEENPGKRVFLLSQMIHNPLVNDDLRSRGIQFIMDTDGTQFIPWEELNPEDIVIIPAFGTTLEIEKILKDIGIEIQRYNTTCPFVEKVWKRSEKLSRDEYTIIIHGKHRHEETRATFSHSSRGGSSVIIRDMEEAKILAKVISGELGKKDFYKIFEGKYSQGFDPDTDLARVGVVNQTTMLATETQAIADYVKQVVIDKFGSENLGKHFADTRDTLCYATNDNQEATYSLLNTGADLALVVGGYNSSNTSHIVELCESKYPTYFINSPDEIKSKTEISHFDYPNKKHLVTKGFLPGKDKIKIVVTSGASCPDTVVDAVILKILSFYREEEPEKLIAEAISNLN